MDNFEPVYLNLLDKYKQKKINNNNFSNINIIKVTNKEIFSNKIQKKYIQIIYLIFLIFFLFLILKFV